MWTAERIFAIRLLKSSRDLLRVLKSFGDHHHATMRMTEEEWDGVDWLNRSRLSAILVYFVVVVFIVINHFNVAVFFVISGCHWFDNELWRLGRGYRGSKSVCNVLIYFSLQSFLEETGES